MMMRTSTETMQTMKGLPFRGVRLGTRGITRCRFQRHVPNRKPYTAADYPSLQHRHERFSYLASFDQKEAERLAAVCYQVTALPTHLRLELFVSNQFIPARTWYNMAIAHSRLLLQVASLSASGLYELLRVRDLYANRETLLLLSDQHRRAMSLTLASFGQEQWRLTCDQDHLYVFIFLNSVASDMSASMLDLSRMYGMWLSLLSCPEITGWQINFSDKLCSLGYQLKRSGAEPSSMKGLTEKGQTSPRLLPRSTNSNMSWNVSDTFAALEWITLIDAKLVHTERQ